MKWLSYKVVVLCLCTNGMNSLLACLIGLLLCWTTFFDLFIATPWVFEFKKMKVVINEKLNKNLSCNASKKNCALVAYIKNQ